MCILGPSSVVGRTNARFPTTLSWVRALSEGTHDSQHNSPHQKENVLNVFAWAAGTFCPHEPSSWNISINGCARRRSLQNVSFVELHFSKMPGPAQDTLDRFEQILTSQLWKYCAASSKPPTRLEFCWPKLCQPPLDCLLPPNHPLDLGILYAINPPFIGCYWGSHMFWESPWKPHWNVSNNSHRWMCHILG